MTVFDLGMWWRAQRVLAEPSLPEDPHVLDREMRRGLAEELQEAGWSYRDISAALDLPTTTLHRWLTDDPQLLPSGPKRNGCAGAIAIGGLLGIVGISAFRRWNGGT